MANETEQLVFHIFKCLLVFLWVGKCLFKLFAYFSLQTEIKMIITFTKAPKKEKEKLGNTYKQLQITQ